MHLRIDSTAKVVDIVINGVTVPARVWEGVTGQGVKVIAFITRLRIDGDADPFEFERDLLLCPSTTSEVEAVPARMVL